MFSEPQRDFVLCRHNHTQTRWACVHDEVSMFRVYSFVYRFVGCWSTDIESLPAHCNSGIYSLFITLFCYHSHFQFALFFTARAGIRCETRNSTALQMHARKQNDVCEHGVCAIRIKCVVVSSTCDLRVYLFHIEREPRVYRDSFVIKCH